MKKLTILLILILLSSCAALENYEFGDITRTVVSAASQVLALKAEYCAEINTEARATLLYTVRLLDPSYDGICTVQ